MKHIGTKTLETERLILRKVTKDDAKEAYDSWCSREIVSKYCMFKTHENVEVTK